MYKHVVRTSSDILDILMWFVDAINIYIKKPISMLFVHVTPAVRCGIPGTSYIGIGVHVVLSSRVRILVVVWSTGIVYTCIMYARLVFLACNTVKTLVDPPLLAEGAFRPPPVFGGGG